MDNYGLITAVMPYSLAGASFHIGSSVSSMYALRVLGVCRGASSDPRRVQFERHCMQISGSRVESRSLSRARVELAPPHLGRFSNESTRHTSECSTAV